MHGTHGLLAHTQVEGECGQTMPLHWGLHSWENRLNQTMWPSHSRSPCLFPMPFPTMLPRLPAPMFLSHSRGTIGALTHTSHYLIFGREDWDFSCKHFPSAPHSCPSDKLPGGQSEKPPCSAVWRSRSRLGQGALSRAASQSRVLGQTAGCWL